MTGAEQSARLLVAGSAGLHMQKCPNTHGFTACPLLTASLDALVEYVRDDAYDEGFHDGQNDGWQSAMDQEHGDPE